MMMTSGQAVKYKNSLDAFNQIVAKEGTKSLFKGAGANILRAIAGAGVLSGYDQLQLIVFGKKFSRCVSILSPIPPGVRFSCYSQIHTMTAPFC